MNTVDSFQGKEKDIVIFNCVRSNKFKSVGFMQDKRRLNVAITRARHAMVFVGNSETMKGGCNFWKSLINHIEKNGQVISVNKNVT